jgi:hypothetical protein
MHRALQRVLDLAHRFGAVHPGAAAFIQVDDFLNAEGHDGSRKAKNFEVGR